MGRLLRAIAVLGLLGCSKAPAPPSSESQPEPPAKSDASVLDAPTRGSTDAKKDPQIPELTERDLALLAKDPSELTREERIQRAYARRRQIMQDPDSPAARMLQDVADAVRNGELDPGAKKSGQDLRFYLPGTKPEDRRPPAGTRADPSTPGDSPTPSEGATP